MLFNEFKGEATIISVMITVKIITFKTFLLTFSLIIFKHILTYILLYRMVKPGNLTIFVQLKKKILF
jgi:hypothetical protein